MGGEETPATSAIYATDDGNNLIEPFASQEGIALLRGDLPKDRFPDALNFGEGLHGAASDQSGGRG